VAEQVTTDRAGVPWPGLRAIRLTSGLILFTYITFHLANHALGNVSLGAMQAGMAVALIIWQGPVGTVALYAGFGTHLSLGLWALYERRYFRWRLLEAVQLTTGLAIPALLINHILVTRVALAAFGTSKTYPPELYALYVNGPVFGPLQIAVLVVAWLHGCIGLHFWLRLKPFYARLVPLFAAFAALLPTLALLGFVQGGRAVAVLAQDAGWRATELSVAHTGTAAQKALLTAWRWDFLGGYAAMIALVLAARAGRLLLEQRRGLVQLVYLDGPRVRIPRGVSVLEASLLNRVAHAHVCGGRGRCSTCRVRVFAGHGALPAPNAAEHRVLARLGQPPNVRLACQLRPGTDLAVARLLPHGAGAAMGWAGRQPRTGSERFVVIMFVDMRGSTRLTEQRLAFDTVFIINRFLTACGSAITLHGGSSNQILGDGLLALFGLRTPPAESARAALRACAAIAANIADLNSQLAADLTEPLRFGIGLHCGDVVLGDIGFSGHSVFTALGDPVHVAARLQDMTKDLGRDTVFSDDIARLANLDTAGLADHLITVRGREACMRVFAAEAGRLAV